MRAEIDRRAPTSSAAQRRAAPGRPAGAALRPRRGRRSRRSPSRPRPSSPSWADELTESELESLRDPRNWVRPVAAIAVGGAAAGALVLVECAAAGEAPAASRQRRGGAARPAPLGGSTGSLRRARLAGRRRRRQRPRAMPVSPRIRCRKLSSVLTGTRSRMSPTPFVGDEEAPDREHEVEQRRRRGGRPRA